MTFNVAVVVGSIGAKYLVLLVLTYFTTILNVFNLRRPSRDCGDICMLLYV